MEAILQGYEVNGPTWFYLSSLLILAVYFRFNRIWSIRNVDLLLLLSLSPGLLLIAARPEDPAIGYVWLFTLSGALLLRTWLDPVLTRRPRLEQNLNPAGLAFLCLSAVLFLSTKIITEEPHDSAVATVRQANDLLNRQDTSPSVDAAEDEISVEEGDKPSPTGTLIGAPLVPLTGGVERLAARWLAVIAHAAVLLGLIFMGRWHFSDTNMGLAMATLYLLLPCTVLDVSKVNHVLPAAFLVWAIVFHSRPVVAGGLLGFACGTLFFPTFLLPIWLSFYWKRGALKFAASLVLVGAFLLGSLALTSADSHSFTRQIFGSINWSVLKFQSEEGVGFWSLYNPAYRIPVFSSFLVMLTLLSIWPWRKNLEHLLSHSAAVIIGTQFWYPHHGGQYILWYLPLLLLIVFRPRLAHLPPAAAEDVSALAAQTSGRLSAVGASARRPFVG
ncbi:MAG: hypothetical protein U0872_10600 [Planctomycetaceae bacterium]